MSQALILLVAGFGFFSSSSVSFAERSDAVWTNPAGRVLHPEGLELQSGFVIGEDNPRYEFGLSLASLGVGYSRADTSGTWTVGLGLPLGRRFRLGGAYFGGGERFWRFGFQTNPLNWLALGGTLQTGDTLALKGGLGLRPFTDRITLFSDLSYEGEIKDIKAGLGVEPLAGVLFFGSMTQSLATDGELGWSAGADIALANFKVGASYDSEGAVGVNLGLSFPRYPSIRFRKPGPKVVAWKPEGRPEEPRPPVFKFAAISFGRRKAKSFYDLLTELRDLGERSDIKGILLDFRGASYSLYQAEEIRKELGDLKDKGIKIISFSQGYSLSSYYLASISDKIYMVPTGEIALLGGYARTLHLKGTLDKLGIEPDFYRVGEYKSAYELFNFSEPSKEDREQLGTYLSSFFDVVLGAIERDRGIAKADFERIMNQRIIVEADTARVLDLVDDLCMALDLDSIIREEFGKDAEQVKFAKLSKEEKEIARSWVESGEKGAITGPSKLAIVVAEGGIVTGESGTNPIPLIGGKLMGSKTISEALEKLRKDKHVKAVVFRINSGGGSALASEIINRALTGLAASKPVIVSMAGVAGSGGYYIAVPADKIYTDATTITGSIGVLGGKFVTKGFNEKLGINRETVKLYPHSDMFSPDRPFDEAEAELMQQLTDASYADFVNRVAEGRDMTFEEVDSVARGRIWSGPDGVRVGLVDEVGGIMDAVEEARKRADLPEDVEVLIYPKPKPMFEWKDGFETGMVIDWKMLPSWLEENFLYLVPYQIEVVVE